MYTTTALDANPETLYAVGMNWSFRQQVLYALGVIFFLGLLGVGSWFFFIYTPPSCTDSVMNQNETGVDCGGVCANLCEAPKVSAVWSRAVYIAPGVHHAVALVRNPESSAGARSLPYTFSIFDSDNILIAERRGTMYLNPGEITPLFEGGIITGERIPFRTFITFGAGVWSAMEPVSLPIQVSSQLLDAEALRLTARIENTSPTSINDITVTALLFADEDHLITASQTSIDTLAPRGSREVVFTWQEPFAEPIIRTDIITRLKVPQ